MEFFGIIHYVKNAETISYNFKNLELIIINFKINFTGVVILMLV